MSIGDLNNGGLFSLPSNGGNNEYVEVHVKDRDAIFQSCGGNYPGRVYHIRP